MSGPTRQDLFALLCGTLLVLLCICHSVKGDVIISPPGVATVCSGHQLELTCSTSGGTHEWSFSFTRSRRAIVSSLPDNQTSYLLVSSVTLNFSRVSSEGSLPLISRLLISPVSDGLNGSTVSCTDLITPESASTSINIIGNSQLQSYNSIIIHVVSEVFESNRVIVTLEWTQISSLHFYNVSVIPSQSVEVIDDGTRVQLALSYNTQYHVSVVARHLCGQTCGVSNFTEIHYTSCPNPKASMDISPTVMVNDYSSPLLEGTNITLRCPSGYEINGSNTSTCLDSGLWEPDPGEVECIPTERSESLNNCGINIAVASSLAVFVVSSVFFFIIGFLCRHFAYVCGKREPLSETVSPPEEKPTPLYDVIPLQQEQELELNTNVAYGTTCTSIGAVQ